MNLPFTSEQFLGLFRSYNDAIWPLQFFLYALALASVVLLFLKKAYAGRIIAHILAFFWYWMGLVYHLMFFSSINKAALVFGVLCIIQGGLFHWFGAIRNRMEFRNRFDLRGSVGLLFILYSLLIYPLLGDWLGHSYPQAPTFGAPCPTTIFTFGILLFTGNTLPRMLLIIPTLWSIIGFGAALSLGIEEDIGLLVAGITSAGLLAFRKQTQTAEASS